MCYPIPSAGSAHNQVAATPAGSYTVTLDSDSEIRSIGTFSAGTLEVPRVYTFDH